MVGLVPANKSCSACGETKPAADFYRRKRTNGGVYLYSRCKPCWGEYNRPKVQAWRQGLSADQRATLAERNRAYCKKWRGQNGERHREASRQWYYDNKDRALVRSTKWAQDNPDKQREAVRKSSRKWRQRNADKLRADGVAYRKAHPEKIRRYAMHRAALKSEAEGYYTDADVARIYDEQRGLCYYCRCELNGDFQIDHMTPLSRGGSNWPSNLCCACARCNRKKNAKTADEYIMEQTNRL